MGSGVSGEGTGLERGQGAREVGGRWWVLAATHLPGEPEIANPANLLHSYIHSFSRHLLGSCCMLGTWDGAWSGSWHRGAQSGGEMNGH